MTKVIGAAPDPKPAAPPPVLVTKFHPPAARDHTVQRERLTDRLRDPAGCKLTLIAAPAGSGKTTRLASWREIETAGKGFAWVSIDEEDNDVVGLWAHVVEALCRASPALAESVSPQFIADARLLEPALRRLMNALADQGEIVLVLDDFHRLSSGPARDSIRWVVDHAPSSFRLVLSTRTEPDLPLAALRAHGELLEVRAHDLRFTSEETETLQRPPRARPHSGGRRPSRRPHGWLGRGALPGRAFIGQGRGPATLASTRSVPQIVTSPISSQRRCSTRAIRRRGS